MKKYKKIVWIFMMIISIVLMINLNIVKTKADNVNSLIYADEFTYIEEGNDIAILKYIGSHDKHLVIPEIINGKNVTVIKEDAFYGSQDVYTLRIPKTVNRIEGGAFSHCMNLNEIKVDKNNEYYLSEDGIVYTKGKTILVSCPSQKTNIIIPDTVTRIEKCSFSACKDLKIIEIPDSVTSIGSRAFEECTGLIEMTISNKITSIGGGAFSRSIDIDKIKIKDDNQNYLIEDGILYTKDKTILIACSSEKTDVSISSTVTRIDSYAFSYCQKLMKVNIPDSVTSIGVRAFEKCNRLFDIEIPSSVTSIEEYAFVDCKSLDIEIPSSITKIEKGTFSSCGFKKIKIPDSVTSIGDNAFNHCLAAREVEISDSVISIGSYAFFFSYLESIEIPSSVKYIGKGAIDCTIYGEKGSSAEEYSITDGNVKFKTFGDKEREKIIDKFVPYLLFTILLIIIFYFVWKNKLKKSDM